MRLVYNHFPINIVIAKDKKKWNPKKKWASNKKNIPCCYFLRNMCENGDDCKFGHDQALIGLDTCCSWGKDCRYGHYYDPSTDAATAE